MFPPLSRGRPALGVADRAPAGPAAARHRRESAAAEEDIAKAEVLNRISDAFLTVDRGLRLVQATGGCRVGQATLAGAAGTPHPGSLPNGRDGSWLVDRHADCRSFCRLPAPGKLATDAVSAPRPPLRSSAAPEPPSGASADRSRLASRHPRPGPVPTARRDRRGHCAACSCAGSSSSRRTGSSRRPSALR